MFSITLAFLILALSLWMLWRKKNFSQLKELGIPGPEPNIFFGNLWEVSQETPLVCHKKWAKKYGKVFGYYMGAIPIVVVSDLDLLKRIQVSEFHNFINRPNIFSTRRGKPQKGDGFSYQITNLKDKRWKEIRSILTPSFTTSKMKLMSPIINKAIDTLIEKVDEKSAKNEDFDIYEFYQGLTMDVIGRTAFGIQTDCQRNPDDPLLRSARVLFGGQINSFTVLLAFSFPELRFWTYIARLRLIFRNRGINPVAQMIDAVKEVIQSRRSDDANRRHDLLQLMIDAQLSHSELNEVTGKDLTAGEGGNEEEVNAQTENVADEKKLQKNVRSMADYEILDNAILFFLAGYETTSTTLAFVTHFLLHYPEVQERMREEVDDLMKREGKLDYVSVQQLQYMEQVVNEALRMYPPIYLFVNREVGQDVQLENFRLKKGLALQIPAHLIQHDEDYWKDPDNFDPDRFSPENKGNCSQLAFQAFGNGPRNCVGMRFAQMEAKLALARLLYKYKFVRCERSDKLNLNLKVSAATITPGRGIYLKAMPVSQ